MVAVRPALPPAPLAVRPWRCTRRMGRVDPLLRSTWAPAGCGCGCGCGGWAPVRAFIVKGAPPARAFEGPQRLGRDERRGLCELPSFSRSLAAPGRRPPPTPRARRACICRATEPRGTGPPGGGDALRSGETGAPRGRAHPGTPGPAPRHAAPGGGPGAAGGVLEPAERAEEPGRPPRGTCDLRGIHSLAAWPEGLW